jgi:hypothetical protein
VCAAYIADYKDKVGPITPGAVSAEPVSTSINISVLVLTHSQVDDDDDDFSAFANISVTKHIGSRASELQEYLWKPIKNIKEPLKWWVANCHVYPNLHWMVLDYLSIPGT